jgi:hypothetical protein
MPTATVQQEINALYLALYGRAADEPGYKYWVNTLKAQPGYAALTEANAAATPMGLARANFLGQQFVDTQSAYFNSVYGGMSDAQFVQALYKNLGSWNGNPAGIAYWMAKLAALEGGSPTPGQIQDARAAMVGQFVHDIVEWDQLQGSLSNADYQAALKGQHAMDNRVQVSEAYVTASTPPGGAFLDPANTSDAAFHAAVRATEGVTDVDATRIKAINDIQQALATHDLEKITGNEILWVNVDQHGGSAVNSQRDRVRIAAGGRP